MESAQLVQLHLVAVGKVALNLLHQGFDDVLHVDVYKRQMTSLPVHLHPINVVVYNDPEKSNLVEMCIRDSP